MSQAYTPGLKVTHRTHYRARRTLPISGEVLVQVGQRMSARDVVAQTFLPGPVTPLNLANLLSIPPGDLPAAMLKQEGEAVVEGELLARSKGMFGWFKTECASPAAGTIESISGVTGQIMLRGSPIPIQLPAYLAGTVTEIIPNEGVVIEASASLVQGIFGIGGEAFGPIRMSGSSPAQNLTADLLRPDFRGAIVIGGGRVTAEVLAHAVKQGVAAVVTGGIDDQDLRDFLGYDLGVATTGSENVGLTLIITEGFGDIAMAERTYRLLESRAGCDAAVNGATQIRAGVLRPEVVIPWPVDPASLSPAVGYADSAGEAVTGRSYSTLREGAGVRIIRDPYFGIIGTVSGMPADPRILGSGSRARVLEVVLTSGEKVLVPRANVELLEE